MKRLFIIIALFAAPAWADDDIISLQKQVAQQEREIRSLTMRLEHMQDAMIQEHDEHVTALRPSYPQPTANDSQDFNRIEAADELQKAVVDAESNRDEIYWMEHKY